MQVRQLECFRTLMIHGTMTRTAQLLRVSQPSVSAIIDSLEREVSFPLFVRKAGRLQATPEARLFYLEVIRALEAVENAKRMAEAIRTGRRGHLAIVAYPSISISLLPRVLSLFSETRPDLEIKIITRNSQAVRELVATEQYDLAIAELPIDYPATHMEVFSYACECMMPIGHPLAERSVLTPSDLDNVPFVTLFRGDPVYQQLAAAFSEEGARWNVVAETELFSTACELVGAGYGVGIVDPVVSAPFTAHVVRRPFLPTISYQVAILNPMHSETSQIARDFVALLRTHLVA